MSDPKCDVLKEMDDYIEAEVSKLTKVQQRVLNRMRWDGCFIIMRRGEFTWYLVDPKLEVVQRIDPRTLTALDPMHVQAIEMGKYGVKGRFYVAHEHMRHGAILRACEMGRKYAKKGEK